MIACEPLAPEKRGAFVEAVAAALATCPAIGPGAVHRIIVDVQRTYFDPPILGHAIGAQSKYR
jgi:hypothetical protein